MPAVPPTQDPDLWLHRLLPESVVGSSPPAAITVSSVIRAQLQKRKSPKVVQSPVLDELVALLRDRQLRAVASANKMLPSSTYREFADQLLQLRAASAYEFAALCAVRDVEESSELNNALRRENVYVRVAAQFVGAEAGDWMRRLLTPLLPLVASAELEINPDWLEGSEEQLAIALAANQRQMQQVLTQVLEAVELAAADVPWKVRWVMHAAYKSLQCKYPDSSHEAVAISGSLLFLRLVTPALTNPRSAGIEITVDREARRKLVTVAKLMQTMANGSMEEEDVENLVDEFVLKHTPRMQRVIKSLVESEPAVEVVAAEANTLVAESIAKW